MNDNVTATDLTTTSNDTVTEPPKKRGFAAMDPEKVKEIATKGGRAAHAQGTAHRFTSAEAKLAGKKGGNAPHRSRGRVSSKSNSTERSG